MGSIGLTFAIIAIGEIIGSQIYLRVALRDARRRRSVDRIVAACAAVAAAGYSLATMDCVSSRQCAIRDPISITHAKP